jgi:hypothetical protein
MNRLRNSYQLLVGSESLRLWDSPLCFWLPVAVRICKTSRS